MLIHVFLWNFFVVFGTFILSDDVKFATCRLDIIPALYKAENQIFSKTANGEAVCC
jgi:hypothetical protein